MLALVLAGCTYNPAELTDRLTDIKDRIEKLQTRIESMNTQLAALETITVGNVITAVEVDANGNYLIKYKDSKNEEKAVVIATQSQMLNVPLLGVKKDEASGLYYWTLTIDGDSDYLLNSDGQKVLVNGKTPVVSVDSEGYWTVEGQRITDANGLPVEANDGESCVFKSLGKNAEGDLVVTLGNGEVLTIPVQDVLNLTLSAPLQYTVADPNAPMVIEYDVVGQNAEGAIVAVAEVAEGIKAAIDREKKTITLTFDSNFNGGHVIVVANDMANHTVLRPVFLEKMKDPRVFIRTAAELVAFAESVNGGNVYEGMQVFLDADIDMKDVAWTPIGNATFDLAVVTGPVFSGTFDGQGHTVNNLKINNEAVAENGVIGLFGVIDGAVVKNVTIGEGSSYNVKGSATETCCFVGGVVAVAVGESTVENCINKAAIHVNQPVTKHYSEGGVVGHAYAEGVEITIANCKNYGTLGSETASTNNGLQGLQLGGIIGGVNSSANDKYYVIVKDSENNGTINAKAARAGGIAGVLNKAGHVLNCVNNGDVNNANVVKDNRNGGIVGLMQNISKIEKCVNNGNVTFNVEGDTTHGYVGGIVGQTGHNDDVIEGCENYGAIRSDIIKASDATKRYVAVIVGNSNNKTCTIKDCKVSGKIGPYVEDATNTMTSVDADNFADYIWFDNNKTNTGNPVLENNVFGGPVGEPEPEPAKGINTLADFIAFRDAVNAGAELTQWQDENGVINLNADIDMASVTDWTPIGNGVFAGQAGNKTSSYTGTAFKGVFDGNNHILMNMKMKADLTGEGAVFGLFGIIDGATVRNLVVGAEAGDAGFFEVSSADGAAETGVIAAVCYSATVENCVNNIPVRCLGVRSTDNKRMTCGMVGFLYGIDEAGKESVLRKLVNNAPVTAETGVNTKNGATGVQVGAIAGFANGLSVANPILVTECVNNGDMTSTTGRTSGIVASCNRGTKLEKCINNGNQLNTYSPTGGGRIGNMTCMLSTNCSMVDCVNNGDAVTNNAATHIGGLVALMNGNSTITGGGNYGDIIGDASYHGTLVANINAPGMMDNIIAGGGFGSYNGGSYQMVEITADNYMNYIGVIKSGFEDKVTNIIFPGSGETPGGPETGENKGDIGDVEFENDNNKE